MHSAHPSMPVTPALAEIGGDMLHDLVTAELLSYEDYRAELDRRAALAAASATDHKGISDE